MFYAREWYSSKNVSVEDYLGLAQVSHDAINPLKQKLAWWLPLLRCWFWHYKACSEIPFRSPAWAREHGTLVSLRMWPFQHWSHRKPFRSRDVIFQRLGLSLIYQKLCRTGGCLWQWWEARIICSWQESANFWCAERYWNISRCSCLLILISQLSSLFLWQACGVDFEVKAFSTENVEERIHRR